MGRVTHCGEEAGDCLGGLASTRVEEEDIERVGEEVEAIVIVLQLLLLVSYEDSEANRERI